MSLMPCVCCVCVQVRRSWLGEGFTVPAVAFRLKPIIPELLRRCRDEERELRVLSLPGLEIRHGWGEGGECCPL